jgi:hypothetical protein
MSSPTRRLLRWEVVSIESEPAAVAKRPSPGRITGLTLALFLALGSIWWQNRPPSESKTKFCTTEGLIGPGTEGYQKNDDCEWVDKDGNPTTTSMTTTSAPPP